MNKLSVQDRVQILNCLSEGMGVNATARVTGKSKNTVLKLLEDVGEACSLYQDRVMHGLQCQLIQCDEIWSFIGAKQAHVKREHPADYGDVYTYTAIDPESKLMPCWLVGVRNKRSATAFMRDLAGRLANRVQLSTDGWNGYPDAVWDAFGPHGVDYAMLNKSYADEGAVKEAKRRYSPAPMINAEKIKIQGNPDMEKVSTSHAERA